MLEGREACRIEAGEGGGTEANMETGAWLSLPGAEKVALPGK